MLSSKSAKTVGRLACRCAPSGPRQGTVGLLVLCAYTRVMVVPTHGGQSHVSSLLWLLKVIKEGSHEGFPSERAWTPAKGLWHGSCWLAKPSFPDVSKLWGVALGPCLWCMSLLSQAHVRMSGLHLLLVLAPATPIHPSRDWLCSRQIQARADAG